MANIGPVPVISVVTASPLDAGPRALLAASHAYLQCLYPPEHTYFLDITALTAPHITFLLALEDKSPRGCAAVADMNGYAEIKSMFVTPEARGTGIGAALLQAIEAVATARATRVLRLETGDTLYPAHRLYARRGFTIRGPFGDYAEGPHSVFMEKRL